MRAKEPAPQQIQNKQVYVFWSPRRGQYKIGHGDTASRLNSKTMCPDLKLVAAAQDANAATNETGLHDYFKAERDGGEWFNHSPRLEDWVNHFCAHPYVARTLQEIPNSWATVDVFPWGRGEVDRTNETGQGVLDIGVDLDYIQPTGRAAPKGNGYAQISSISEDWYTHPVLTEAVRELYDGSIDLDPMSCLEANRCYVKAEMIYTAQQDGLSYEWKAPHVLLNPPWGGKNATSTKFRAIKKALHEYNAGNMEECVLILNSNATTTGWFEPLFRFPMCFPPRRIPHKGPRGKGGSPNSGTVIVFMPDVGNVEDRTNRFADIFQRIGNVVVPLRRANASAVAHAENYDD